MNEKRTAKLIATIGVLLVLISVLLVACSSETEVPADPTSPPDSPTEHVHDELIGDSVRGGTIYDKWWVVVGADEPADDHPLWATQSNNERSGKDTWRCKECHGWDYKGAEGAYSGGSHMTGFVGVIQLSGADPNDILDAMKGGTNPDHDFSTVMDEQALIDLALFISEATLDYGQILNDKVSTGDAAAGEALYTQVCAACHGADGTAINFHDVDDPEYLAHIASGNPWEFAHKVRFGQPGSAMPSGIEDGWSLDDVADVLAYVQTFPTEPAREVGIGGLLYDKWWKVLGLDEPTEDNPLWATQDTNTRSGKDTWRCKECHGWDYKGVDGAYSSGSHMTGFTGVLGAASMSDEDITAWLTGGMNPDHDFSAMGEDGVAALVVFFQEDMTDPSPYINADKSSTGDAARGQEKYEATCAACHGMDGTAINFHDADEPAYIGTVATDNPWEFIHKVSYGQPATGMPSGFANGWSMEEIADVLAFAQTLPTE